MHHYAEIIQLTLQIESDKDIRTNEDYDIVQRLRDELIEDKVEFATFAPNSQNLPEGAKSGAPVDWMTLIVGVSIAAIPNIILLIQNWLLRQQNQNIKVKIGEVEMEVPRNAKPNEIERIVDAIKSIRLSKTK